METPVSVTSDHNIKADEDTLSSANSTPVHDGAYEPFQPQFVVKVTEPVKNGDVVNYTVKTTKVCDGSDSSVSRQYEDFEFLHHCLITQNDMDGIILPPLPSKPTVEAKEAELKSKKHLGSSSKTLIGDEFDKDCRNLEKYLRLVIGHEVLGRCSSLDAFLLQKQAPAVARVKQGLFGKLFSAAEEARKANHADIDDYFQKARDSANAYSTAIQQAANAFNQVVHCEQRVSLAYAQLSTTLNAFSNGQDDLVNENNRLLVKFSESIDDAKQGVDVDIVNDENTLGFWLNLHARYSTSVREMLYRRTCLMVNYEDSNRALDKAKPAKKHAAEEAKLAAETAFENCSEVARKELAVYQLQRRISFQEALCVYVEAKIKTARDTYALLARSLLYFKQLDKPATQPLQPTTTTTTTSSST